MSGWLTWALLQGAPGAGFTPGFLDEEQARSQDAIGEKQADTAAKAAAEGEQAEAKAAAKKAKKQSQKAAKHAEAKAQQAEAQQALHKPHMEGVSSLAPAQAQQPISVVEADLKAHIPDSLALVLPDDAEAAANTAKVQRHRASNLQCQTQANPNQSQSCQSHPASTSPAHQVSIPDVSAFCPDQFNPPESFQEASPATHSMHLAAAKQNIAWFRQQPM